MKIYSDVKIGQYVKSKAGRDKNHVFIVIDVIDFEYVYLADGDVRRLESPKKKKLRHLINLKQISDVVSEKVDDNKKLTNLMLRKEIGKLDLSIIKTGGF